MADFDVLSPGDYGIDYQDPGQKAEEYPTRCFWTIPVPYPNIRNYVRHESDPAEDEHGMGPAIPEDLLIEGKQRSQSRGTCVLTGSTGREILTQWISPPLLACNLPILHGWPSDIDLDQVGLTHVANLISMRKDLYELFFENVFGVDVDDNFKIRIFHPSGKAVGLPDRLVIPEPDEHTKYFLDEHFRWCLNVHFHGGSIEYDQRLSRGLAKEFLVKLSRARDKDAVEWLRLKDEDWETQLGQAILEFLRFLNPNFKIPKRRRFARRE